jgi:hypothetical protein
MAAFGIPKTIQLFSSWATVRPPAFYPADALGPVFTMPVMITPRAFGPYSSATDWKSTS